jgi:hypothetical protein
MPSANYRLFAQAIVNRVPICCMYNGLAREFHPAILGHKRGHEASLAYQFGGESSQGHLQRGGAWKCLELANVTDAHLGEGPWRTGDSHKRPQSCVDDVDLDVNPASPYSPRRKIGSLRTDSTSRRGRRRRKSDPT